MMNCPKCLGVMLKYRIAADNAHKLDYCFHCEEVCLDGGEWDLPKSRGLQTQVMRISTDGWQRKIREDQAVLASQARYREKMGDEMFALAEEFRLKLNAHPNPEVVPAFLTAYAWPS